MEWFDGELDSEEIIEGLLDAFPLRVRVVTRSAGVGRTGGLVAGDVAVLAPVAGASYEAIPATKTGPHTRGESIEEGGGMAGVAHVWTLLGSWPAIASKMLLQTVDDNGAPVGATYEVLLADVHDFGIHTEVRTRAAG